ncbi:hypothetical protein BC829DRAFT_444336 [Chytridium lagenaria]|nr:hypothetical protein BC829DRAFT_444336 [Chytridium lagenaria]
MSDDESMSVDVVLAPATRVKATTSDVLATTTNIPPPEKVVKKRGRKTNAEKAALDAAAEGETIINVFADAKQRNSLTLGWGRVAKDINLIFNNPGPTSEKCKSKFNNLVTLYRKFQKADINETGNRTFTVEKPPCWNSLVEYLQNIDDLGQHLTGTVTETTAGSEEVCTGVDDVTELVKKGQEDMVVGLTKVDKGLERGFTNLDAGLKEGFAALKEVTTKSLEVQSALLEAIKQLGNR